MQTSAHAGLYACAVGDAAALGNLVLSKQIDPNGTDTMIGAFAMVAAQNGHVTCLRGLLQARANPDQRSTLQGNVTPLLAAAQAGRAECVTVLLEASADPNLQSAGLSPLHCAASSGSTACCRALLAAQADPFLQAPDGIPLERAKAHGNEAAALILAAAMSGRTGHALPNARLEIENRSSKPVRLCYILPGNLQEVTTEVTLQPCTKISTATYAGHEWRLRSEAHGILLSSYVVQATPAQQLLHPQVEFEWEDGPHNSGNWKRFDDEMSLMLQHAVAAGQATLVASARGSDYEVNLAAMTQRNTRTGFVRRLRACAPPPPAPPMPPPAASLVIAIGGPRLSTLQSFPGGYEAAPTYWDGTTLLPLPPGNEAPLAIHYPTAAAAISLSHESPIFQEVLQVLGESSNLGALHLASVSCVRNVELFDLYQAQKKAMHRRLGAEKTHERWLWHGTAKGSISGVLTNGFLRDFNTRGAFGQGTYFAKAASYSLNPMYAKPEPSGDYYLLLCRVLVGEACVGHANMDRPDSKPQADGLLFESMVDKLPVDSSKIFVLSAGSDNRAYPEFVLRFQLTPEELRRHRAF